MNNRKIDCESLDKQMEEQFTKTETSLINKYIGEWISSSRYIENHKYDGVEVANGKN